MKHVLATCLIVGIGASSAAAQTNTPTQTTPTTPSVGSTGTTGGSSTTGTTGTTNSAGTSATGSAGTASSPGSWYASQQNEMRASKLIGTTVRNNAGENIGEINEILLDPQGRVAAIIIGVGGFLGLGEREVAISPQGYQMTRDRNGNAAVMVNANAELLRNAPVWRMSNN